MFKVIFAFSLLAACSRSEKPAPMLQGTCADHVVPNLFGPGIVSYQECQWRQRIWVCRFEVDNWRCVAVAEEPTRTAPEAPAAPSPADPNE